MFKTSQKVSKTDPFVRTTNIDILPGACVYDRNVHCIVCMLSYLLNRSSTQHIQYRRPSIEKKITLCVPLLLDLFQYNGKLHVPSWNSLLIWSFNWVASVKLFLMMASMSFPGVALSPRWAFQVPTHWRTLAQFYTVIQYTRRVFDTSYLLPSAGIGIIQLPGLVAVVESFINSNS